jgi:uracil-DNA glycosylase
VTDPRDLWGNYLQQRIELGETRLVLDGRGAGSAFATPLVGRVVAPEPAADREPARPEARRPERPARGAESWREGAPEIPTNGIQIVPPEQHLFVSDPMRDTTLETLAELIRACRKCKLCQGRKNAVPGEGPLEAKLMVVGEGPGATEDDTGRPFVGKAGQLLTEILAAIDCPRETVFIANIVKCRPPDNREPDATEVEQCMPYLNRQIAIIKPAVIIAMGRTAATALLNTKSSLSSLRNKVHSYRGFPLIVTYHPAALLRNPHWKKPTWDDVRIARRLLAGERRPDA